MVEVIDEIIRKKAESEITSTLQDVICALNSKIEGLEARIFQLEELIKG